METEGERKGRIFFEETEGERGDRRERKHAEERTEARRREERERANRTLGTAAAPPPGAAVHEPRHLSATSDRLLHARYAVFSLAFSFLFCLHFRLLHVACKRRAGGRKIILPPLGCPRWASPMLAQPDTSGPVLAQTVEVIGPRSAQVHFWAEVGPCCFYLFFGLSLAHLFGSAQPDLFLYYLLYIIYYNVL